MKNVIKKFKKKKVPIDTRWKRAIIQIAGDVRDLSLKVDHLIDSQDELYRQVDNDKFRY